MKLDHPWICMQLRSRTCEPTELGRENLRGVREASRGDEHPKHERPAIPVVDRRVQDTGPR